MLLIPAAFVELIQIVYYNHSMESLGNKSSLARGISIGAMIATLSLAGCERESATTCDGLDSATPESEELWAALDTTSTGVLEIWEQAAAGDEDAAMAALRTRFAMQDLPAQFTPYAYHLLKADSLLQGVWMHIGHPAVTLPLDPDWTANPVGDPNWAFQYHSWLAPACLIYAYEDTGNPAYLDYYLFLLDDWISENYEADVWAEFAWYDHAVANRVAGWLAALPIIADEATCSDDLFERWLLCLLGSFSWLADDENYNALSNHGLFMNLALLEGCARLADFSSTRWQLPLAIYRTESQLFTATTPHGVNREQTPYYHTRVWNSYRNFQPIIDAVQIDFSTAFFDAIDGMGNFHAYLLRPDLDYPMFGDGARDFNPAHLLPYPDPEVEFVATRGQSGQQPEDRYRLYPESGYIFLRSGWGQERAYEDEVQMALDFGPHGSTSHGHHDHGSFEIYAYGQSWLVDSGYYAVSGPDRIIFTAPRAHNVVTLPETTTFPHDEEIVRWFTSPKGAMAEARLALGGVLQHYRSVLYLPPSDFLIVDRIPGISYHALQQIFHFHPDLDWRFEDEAFMATGVNAELALQQLLPTATPALIEGGENQGWYSEAYGERVPNPALVYEAPAIGTDKCWATWISLADNPDQPVTATLVEWSFAERIRVELSGPGGSRQLLLTFGPEGFFEISE